MWHTAMELRINLLGRFEVFNNGIEVTSWSRPVAKRLLKLLATEPKHAISIEDAALALWPKDGAGRIDQRLHHAVYLLRCALKNSASSRSLDDALLVRSRVITLGASDKLNVQIDIDVFEHELEEALLDGPDIARLERALRIYKGPLLPSDTKEHWLASPRHQLQQRYLTALRMLSDIHARNGDYDSAIAMLQQILLTASADEPTHRTLISLYGRIGHLQQAVRQFQECKSALRQELGIAPDEDTKAAYLNATGRLHANQNAGVNAASATAPTLKFDRKWRPPAPLVRLISRESAATGLREQIRRGWSRLITLIGVGGVGKTQLAIRVANELQAEYRQGVGFVSLDDACDEDLMVGIARALDIAVADFSCAESDIAGTLRDAHMLLVLDNLERATDGLVALTRLLQRCPQLTILATRRRRLGLASEQTVLVKPLDCGAQSGHEPHKDRPPAAIFFMEVAKAVDPTFKLNAATLPHVTAITQALGGVPLAIELAVARLRVLSIGVLRQSIELDPTVVAGGGPDRHPRQRSLKASFDWSFQLLSSTAQATLQQLSLFHSVFTVKMAAAVCGKTISELLEDLQTLIDGGFIANGANETTAIDQLQLDPLMRKLTVKLIAPSDPQRQHKINFACAIAEVALHLRQKVWARKAVAAEQMTLVRREDMLFALEIANQEDNYKVACELLQGLCVLPSFDSRDSSTEAWIRRWLADGDRLDPKARAWLYFCVGRYWFMNGNLSAAHECTSASLRFANVIGDEELICYAKIALASIVQHEAVTAMSTVHDDGLASACVEQGV